MNRQYETLENLLDMIDGIDRDDEGDAMLDSEGLSRLQNLARKLRSPSRFEPTAKAPGDIVI